MEIRLDLNERLEMVEGSRHRRRGATIAALMRRVFSRFAANIIHLQVTLRNKDGASGGRSKLCMLRARLADGREVVVIDRSRRMRRAITRCLSRAKGVVAREVARRRIQRRRAVAGRQALAFT